jgi:hypothetical protein
MYRTVLNSFVFSVSAPGSGKSNVYHKVLKSVMNDYQSRHGGDKTIHIESYTTAGIHEHQRKNDGYGLITTDEGHRLIASIQQKQAKEDSERALLCKFWGGIGDSVALLAGNRGFNQTSMSICCYNRIRS